MAGDGVGTCGRVWGYAVSGGGMSQGVGSCGRVWGHMAVTDVCGRGSALWHKWVHVAVLGTYGRVWGHVVGCGGMWQRCGRVWGHVTGGGVCGMRSGLIAWTGTCGRAGPCGMVWGPCSRVWEHVVEYGVMWQGVEACHKG